MFVHQQINKIREEHGLQSLLFADQLRPVARYHSGRMAEAGTIFHTAPDGESLSDRLQKVEYELLERTTGQRFCHGCGYDLRPIRNPSFCPSCGVRLDAEKIKSAISGENVAFLSFAGPKLSLPSSQEAAVQIVDEWLESPSHRQNIMNGSFDREAIGIATVERGGTQIYTTQLFAGRK